jgi:hypothetical protein
MKQSSFLEVARLPKPNYRTILVAALFAVALLLGTLSFTSAAHAASSVPGPVGGRQLAIVYQGSISHPRSVLITGSNQYGVAVKQCFNTPSFINYDRGHLWRLFASISLFRGYNCTNFTHVKVNVRIPFGWPGSWYPVYIRWPLLASVA